MRLRLASIVTRLPVCPKTVVRRLDVTDCDGEQQFATARFLLEGFERALPKQRQLHFAHRSFHAQQQPIVWMAWVVDAVFVSDQRADQAAELEQRVPIAAVARQTRSLDRDHDADPAFADRGKQLLEARPSDPRTRAAQIVVDHLDRSPAKRTGAVGHPILSAAAFVVVEHLVGSRPPHVYTRLYRHRA